MQHIGSLAARQAVDRDRRAGDPGQPRGCVAWMHAERQVERRDRVSLEFAARQRGREVAVGTGDSGVTPAGSASSSVSSECSAPLIRAASLT